MTSEQIAELRRIADGHLQDQQRTDYYERETALAALPKLLDEREALLEAVLFVLTTWDVFDGHEADVRAQQETLQRAVDKAKAP